MFDIFTTPDISIEKSKVFFNGISIDVLRLDTIHPIVSGNKLYKLKGFVTEALSQSKGILTFGGAYSNHILATAYSCWKYQIPCVGIIRGEELGLKPLNNTLIKAEKWGMKLIFVSRVFFRNYTPETLKIIVPDFNNYILVPEGGNAINGIEGCKTILNKQTEHYTHIFVAVGTGATLRGLALGAINSQKILGVPVVNTVYKETFPNNVILIKNAHWGGYAKYTVALINFIENIWELYKLPLDIIYTAKALFAVSQYSFENYHRPLFIHTGGLQGNHTIPQLKNIGVT